MPGNDDTRTTDADYTGRYVAFQSEATNLSTAATSGLAQIFVKDQETYRAPRRRSCS